MGDGEKTGIKAALAETFRPTDPVPGDVQAEQLALLPLSKVAQADDAGADLASPARGPGRPKGSKNKSTEAWREYLASRYSAPLVALAETYSRRTFDLAVEMGYCASGVGERRGRNGGDRREGAKDPRLQRDERRVNGERRKNDHRRRIEPEQMVDLLKVQLQCAKELAPYLHQKMPQALIGDGAGLMQLIINSGNVTAEQVEDAGVMRLDFVDVESESDQGFSGAIKQDSNAQDSNACNQEPESKE